MVARATARIARAAAKINLTLEVLGQRPDGYHGLRSVFLCLSHADELSVEVVDEAPIPGTEADVLEIQGGDAPALDNLVLRAARLLRESAACPLPRLRFRLRKRVAVAAGLGGGSSDAAAALQLALAAWDVALPEGRLAALASRLGSDVPFFCSGLEWALVSGRGEVVEPLPALVGELGVLILTPARRLLTAQVFAAHAAAARQPSAAKGTAATEGETALARVGLVGVGAGVAVADGVAVGVGVGAVVPHGAEVDTRRLVDAADAAGERNDLWAAAASLEPSLATVRQRLEAAIGRRVTMSGSGTSLYGLFGSEAEALEAAACVRSSPEPAFRGATIVVASRRGEPAQGSER